MSKLHKVCTEGDGVLADVQLDNQVKQRRKRLSISQQQLADRTGVSRQAIIAIEAGRQVPSTSLSLLLARVLECSVEHLFQLSLPQGLQVRMPQEAFHHQTQQEPNGRALLGYVSGDWVGHPLRSNTRVAADGIIQGYGPNDTFLVEPFFDAEVLKKNVLVAGCAPLLGALTQRVGSQFRDAQATWLATNSLRSLQWLANGLVHIAGLHLFEPELEEANLAAVRKAFPHTKMLMVNLTRWQQGLIVPPGNPLGLSSIEDVLRPGLRFVQREEGAGATKLVRQLLSERGATDATPSGPYASGHQEVAQFIQYGAGDVGVAIESVAIAAGLDFLPLAEERFDLVLPYDLANTPPVSRFLEALDNTTFQTEMSYLPGYNNAISGHVTTIERPQ